MRYICKAAGLACIWCNAGGCNSRKAVGAENINKNELLPCPFCGGDAEKIVFEYKHRTGENKGKRFTKIKCGCGKCGIYQSEAKHPREAIAEWNTRKFSV